MKLLVDENAPRTIVKALRSYGYDLLWIKERHRGMSDDDIICPSISEKRTILTFDKDFGKLTYKEMVKNIYGIILVRMADNETCIEKILELLENYENKINGHFIVLTEKKNLYSQIARRLNAESFEFYI